MGKRLIIAEKGSVAQDIAKVLGGFSRVDGGWLENADSIITNASGHLVAMADKQPNDPGWSLAALPFMPTTFEMVEVVDRFGINKPLLAGLKKLLKRPDVDVVINACDAGREGELIFEYIYHYFGCKKPTKRLWLQSMTPDAIKAGFNSLRSGESRIPLADAAICRSEADWYMGINGTRAMSTMAQMLLPPGVRSEVSPVGRVQTPTLALIDAREHEIEIFVPVDYWEIHGHFAVAAGKFVGKWFDSQAKTDAGAQKIEHRVFNLSKAREIEAKCRGTDPTSIRDESKPTTSTAPKLFDLTNLQREANSKLGLSAKQTLNIAQELYLKKILTYPRTDAQALPEDYIETVKTTLATFGGTQFAVHAERVLANNWVKPSKKIFDNTKISDHFAIIPTGLSGAELSGTEKSIYEMVVKRFIAIFHPDAEFNQTTRITTVAGESFKSEGKVLVKEGWLAVHGKEASDDGKTPKLPLVGTSEKGRTEDIKVESKQTKPPERYTEATLLTAMEGAGKMIDDDELRAAMAKKGLGTPATRADQIEGLIFRKYVVREVKELIPTRKGRDLIRILRQMNMDMFVSPQMTGDWEFKLAEMEQKRYSRAKFMEEVKAKTNEVIARFRQQAGTIPQAPTEPEVAVDTPCPNCHGALVSRGDFITCGGCAFRLKKTVASRPLDSSEIDALLRKEGLSGLDGFISSAQKPFSAGLMLNPDLSGKVDFVFDNSAPRGDWKPSSAPAASKPRAKTASKSTSKSSSGAKKASSGGVLAEGDACPDCGNGTMKICHRKSDGGAFLGCTNFRGGCKKSQNL